MPVSEEYLRNEYIYGEKEAMQNAIAAKGKPMGVDIEEVLKFEMNRAIMDQLEMKPTTRLLNLDELSTDEIKEYLRTMHTILFLNWTITDPVGMEQAAKWIKDFFDKLYSYIANKQVG